MSTPASSSEPRWEARITLSLSRATARVAFFAAAGAAVPEMALPSLVRNDMGSGVTIYGNLTQEEQSVLTTGREFPRGGEGGRISGGGGVSVVDW